MKRVDVVQTTTTTTSPEDKQKETQNARYKEVILKKLNAVELEGIVWKKDRQIAVGMGLTTQKDYERGTKGFREMKSYLTGLMKDLTLSNESGGDDTASLEHASKRRRIEVEDKPPIDYAYYGSLWNQGLPVDFWKHMANLYERDLGVSFKMGVVSLELYGIFIHENPFVERIRRLCSASTQELEAMELRSRIHPLKHHYHTLYTPETWKFFLESGLKALASSINSKASRDSMGEYITICLCWGSNGGGYTGMPAIADALDFELRDTKRFQQISGLGDFWWRMLFVRDYDLFGWVLNQHSSGSGYSRDYVYPWPILYRAVHLAVQFHDYDFLEYYWVDTPNDMRGVFMWADEREEFERCYNRYKTPELIALFRKWKVEAASIANRLRLIPYVKTRGNGYWGGYISPTERGMDEELWIGLSRRIGELLGEDAENDEDLG